MPKTMLVRLVAYNKRRGSLCRNYVYRGVKFTDKWKEVSPAVAQELKGLAQPSDPDEELPLFEVMTRDEAVAVEAKERDEGKVARVSDAERIADTSLRGAATPSIKDDADAAFEVTPEEDQPEPAKAPSLRPRAKRRRSSKDA